jgi:transcriptional regulator with XRE-family HTH domain
MAAMANHAGGEQVIPTWELQDRLRKARQTTGLDQKDFAQALGVNPGSLAGWEAGRSKPRDVVTVAKRIEMLTRIPAAWVLGVHEEAPRPDGDPNGGLPNDVRLKGFEPLTFWSVLSVPATRGNVIPMRHAPRRRPVLVPIGASA